MTIIMNNTCLNCYPTKLPHVVARYPVDWVGQ